MSEKVPSTTPPLTTDQYARIHDVINSVALHFGNDVGKSCVMFALAGAMLMREHYQMPSRPVCGVGAIAFDCDSRSGLSWLPEDQADPASALHAWVHCDEWLIDFMAPNYHEAVAGATSGPIGAPMDVPRRMLQKSIEDCRVPVDRLSSAGQCCFFPDMQLTERVLRESLRTPSALDVIDLCTAWHVPLPSTMKDSIVIGSSYGGFSVVGLQQQELAGAW